MKQNRSEWKRHFDERKSSFEKIEGEIRSQKSETNRAASASSRKHVGGKNPDPDYVSTYSRELMESIIPLNELLNNEEHKKYLEQMDKEVRLREEIAHYLVKAHNNELKFREDIL